MLRLLLCSTAVLALGLGTLVADDTQKDKEKADKHAKATITKVDPQRGLVMVKMKDKNGKDVQKAFRLTEDIRYLDSTGRAARIDIFQSGDDILVLEEEGRLKEMKKVEHKDKNEGKKPAGSDTEKKPVDK
jgi:hypothetical protein